MARLLPFTKVQGLGNHFVLVEEQQGPCDWGALAQDISRHHLAVGADGVLVVGPSAVADLRMRYFDPDGTEDMCGNGLRCVTHYAFTRGLAPARMTVETIAGVRACEVLESGRVRTAMGHPQREPASLPAAVEGLSDLTDYPVEVLGRTFRLTCVSMGTPHAVIFADEELDDPRWPAWSEALERHPLFPARITVDWVRVLSRSRVRTRPWERHLGETLACGTGASATAVAGVLHGLTDRVVDVEMRGGTLRIEWPEGQQVGAVGEAAIVYTGAYPWADEG